MKTIVRRNNGGATEVKTRGAENTKNTRGKASDKKEIKYTEIKGMYRVYLTYNEGKVGRITYNSLGEIAKKSGKTFEPERGKLRFDMLEATVDTLKALETIKLKKLQLPIVLFMPNNFVSTIKDENYKIWMMTGHFMDGNALDQEELELWEEFDKLRCKYSKILMIREIGENSKLSRQAKDELDLLDIKYTKMSWERVKIDETIEIEEEA